MQLNLSVFLFQLLRSFLRTILFIYFWLRLVFIVARGLSCSHCEQGLLFVAVRGLLGLRSSGSRAWQGTAFGSSPVQAHQLLFSGPRGRPSSCVYGLSSSTASGIFLDQAQNLCLPLWQVDSLPLSHQECPASETFVWLKNFSILSKYFPQCFLLNFSMFISDTKTQLLLELNFS